MSQETGIKDSPPRSCGNISDSAAKRVVTGSGCSRRTTQTMNVILRLFGAAEEPKFLQSATLPWVLRTIRAMFASILYYYNILSIANVG